MTYVIISNKILKVSINFLNRGLAHSINKCRKQNKITQIASNSLSSKNNPPPHLPFKKEHDCGPGYKAMLCLHTVYGRPNRDVRANNLQHLPRGSFPQANFQTLSWHFAFILLSQNPWWVCWLSSLLQLILHSIEKSWGIIATGTFPGLPSALLELWPDEELILAPLGYPPIKNNIPFHGDWS